MYGSIWKYRKNARGPRCVSLIFRIQEVEHWGLQGSSFVGLNWQRLPVTPRCAAVAACQTEARFRILQPLEMLPALRRYANVRHFEIIS